MVREHYDGFGYENRHEIKWRENERGRRKLEKKREYFRTLLTIFIVRIHFSHAVYA